MTFIHTIQTMTLWTPRYFSKPPAWHAINAMASLRNEAYLKT
jgi:hypothetical protein